MGRASGSGQFSNRGGVSRAISSSLEMVVTTSVGGGLGWIADLAVHTTPLFLIIGTVLGTAAGMLAMWHRWSSGSWGDTRT